jgi:hypothetical protein
MIYSVAGGQGKARLSSEAVLRQRYSWTTFILLSGECSLEENILLPVWQGLELRE